MSASIVTHPSQQRLGSNPSHRVPDARSLSLLGLGIVLTWLFLGLYDTGMSHVIPNKSLVRLAIIGILAGLVCLRPTVNPGLRFNRSFIGFALLTLLTGVASSVLCKAPELGLLKLLLYVSLWMPLVCCSRGLTELLETSRGRTCFLITAFLLILLGLYRAFRPAEVEIGNTNFLSAVAVCVMPVFMLEQANPRPLIPRRLNGHILGLAIFICILNHSRGALVSGTVALVSWYALYRSPSISRIAGIFYLGLLTLSLFIVINESLREYVYKGQETLLDRTRINEFDQTFQFVMQRPLLGYGFGLSWRVEPWHTEKVLKHGRISWYIGEFGNSTLAILGGGGLLLLLAFVGMMVTAFSQAIRAMKLEFHRFGITHDYRMLAATFSGALGLLVHSQAEGWMLSPATMATFSFWMFIGMMILLTGKLLVKHRTNPPTEVLKQVGH